MTWSGFMTEVVFASREAAAACPHALCNDQQRREQVRGQKWGDLDSNKVCGRPAEQGGRAEGWDDKMCDWAVTYISGPQLRNQGCQPGRALGQFAM